MGRKATKAHRWCVSLNRTMWSTIPCQQPAMPVEALWVRFVYQKPSRSLAFRHSRLKLPYIAFWKHAAPAVRYTGATFQKALQPPRNMGLRVQATIVYLTQHRSDRISRACFHPLDGIAAFSGGIPSVGDEVAVPLVNSCHIYALQHHVDLYIFTNNKLHSGSTTVLYYEVRHVAIFID